MATMSENAMKVLNFMKGIEGADVTVHDVAEATGLAVNSITGTFNSFVKKELGERVTAEIALDDGTHKAVKFLKLTAKGQAYDPTAEAAE